MNRAWDVTLALVGQINVNYVVAPTERAALEKAQEIAGQYLRAAHVLPDSRELGVHVETILARARIDDQDYNGTVHVEEVQ